MQLKRLLLRFFFASWTTQRSAFDRKFNKCISGNQRNPYECNYGFSSNFHFMLRSQNDAQPDKPTPNWLSLHSICESWNRFSEKKKNQIKNAMAIPLTITVKTLWLSNEKFNWKRNSMSDTKCTILGQLCNREKKWKEKNGTLIWKIKSLYICDWSLVEFRIWWNEWKKRRNGNSFCMKLVLVFG